jgi:ribonuclease PH
MIRQNGRSVDELRTIKITPEVSRYAEGSVMIEMGHTKVLCTASVEANLPKWLQAQKQGWVTAEYGMLPRSTHTRINRDKAMNSGRSQEISRLIGRSLRAAVDLKTLGERQITVDCDVIQADGGTRTAAITGGYIALALCLKFLKSSGQISAMPITHSIAAISVGIQNGTPILDLDYEEDSTIDTDMNFVMTQELELVEVQGTAEGQTFKVDDLNKMVGLAQKGCRELFAAQAKILNP